MDFKKSSGLKLLPKGRPDQEMIGATFQDPRFFQELESLDADFQRSLLWSIALQNAYFESKIPQETVGLRFASVGFADPETETDSFALIVYTTSFDRRPPSKHQAMNSL